MLRIKFVRARPLRSTEFQLEHWERFSRSLVRIIRAFQLIQNGKTARLKIVKEFTLVTQSHRTLTVLPSSIMNSMMYLLIDYESP